MTNRDLSEFAPPPIPEEEEERLEALNRYDIVDTPSDSTLDRIAEIAAKLFSAPIGLVNLIDRHRQVHKSCFGSKGGSADRSLSFCGHTILSDELLIIKDTTKDPRFANHPLVLNPPHFKFYAGAPLVTPDGFRLGALCVVDTRAHPEEVDPKVWDMFIGLSRMVVDEFELRFTTRSLADKNEALRRAHGELNRAQRTLDMALDASMTGAWKWDTETDQFDLHESACRLFGIELSQRSVSLLEAVIPEDRKICDQALKSARKTGVIRPFDIHPRAAPDRCLELRGDRRGPASFLGVVHDVTQQRNAMQGAFRVDRLAAVGNLAFGVGHEINNPLTYVSAGVEYSQKIITSLAARLQNNQALPVTEDERRELSQVVEALNEAHEGINRIGRITAELRRFGSPGETESEPTNIEEILQFALNMTHHAIRHRAELHVEFKPVPVIEVNQTLLAQLLVHLLMNAAQSIEPGHLLENRIDVRASISSDRIIIEIEDTGAGIDPEVMPHIFDPFYTTRAPGEGIGMGLSSSLYIARQLGGDLTIESTPGRGTRARVLLPLSLEQEVPTIKVPVQIDMEETTTEVISSTPQVLFIDDERQIGTAFQRQLSRHAEISVHTRADHALEQLRDGECFDVIFCDLMMPHMGGIDFARTLADELPEAFKALVFMTGGALDEEAQRFIEDHSIPCVFKPVGRKRLLELIEEVMGSP